MKTFQVTRSATLKDFTDETYPQGSFVFNALLKRGDVRINGVKQRKNCGVTEGDTVTYYTTPQEEQKPSHSMIYADQSVIFVDKFSGVSSEALFCELSQNQTVYPVHRLDRNTSGIMVLARTKEAEEELISAFKDRAVDKTYLCFAQNAFKKPSGVLTAFLKKDENTSTVKIYNAPADGRVKIVTEYEVQKSYGDYALVKVILHTGKTHQIRAHLASIGCPVLGDTKYGNSELNKRYSAVRQILVSKSLTFHLSGNLSYLNDKPFKSSFFPALPKGKV